MNRVRFLGHSLHPPSVHVPMGLWLSVPAWDMLAEWTGRAGLWSVAFWCLVGGLVGAVPAVVTGFLEYASLGDSPAAERTADRHWMLAVTAAALFALSAWARGGSAPPARPVWAMVSSLLGAAVLSAAGWHGGELVCAHGVGGYETR